MNFRVSRYHNERDLRLDFPEEWDLVECRMAGHDFPPLSDAGLRKAFANPIGTPRIRDLARGKKKVVILFDDLDRPTPADRIIPYVLRELEDGGVRGDMIRFVCAPGCHRPLIREEMVKKLGREVVEKYSVFNHNIYENLVHMGTTSWGTPVIINREVAGCDLKIGIGCLIPHFSAGYGGGAKILLPGVASIETIAENHIKIPQKYPSLVGLGKVIHNPMRLDMEEAARLAGLDIVVDVVTNQHNEILGAFVGDVVEEHRAGVKFARSVYTTESPGKCDLLVLNTYPVSEAPGKVFWAAKESLREGGDVVLIWQSVDGIGTHYLSGVWGTDYGGRKWTKPEGPFRIPQARKLFIHTDIMSNEEQNWWGHRDKISWHRDWAELIAALKPSHGQGTRVAVYPYASIQCPDLPDE